MKAIALISLLALTLPLAAQDAVVGNSAATADKASPDSSDSSDKPDKTLQPNQQAFLNLPEEKRMEFMKHITKANRIFQQKRIFETIDELDKAAEIFKDSPELHNLRGSCFVEMRAFDKALAEFDMAAALSKDNPNIDFNIGEVYFCSKQWQKSVDVFDKVLKEMNEKKDFPKEQKMSLGRLVEFKIFLCKYKLGDKDEAAKLANKYDWTDDSPYYYYAKAALAYERKDLEKAEEWLARANRVFRDPAILAPWQDTLVEYGYIKSFYGGDQGQ